MGMLYKKKNERDIERLISRRYTVYILIICVLFAVIVSKVFQIQVVNEAHYKQVLEKNNSTHTIHEQPSRGIIYDRNYNIVVQNKPVYTIKYKRPVGYKQFDSKELEMAKAIASMIDMPQTKLQSRDIKDHFIRVYWDEAKSKLTDEERTNNLLSLDERYRLIRSRLTDEDLSVFTVQDLEDLAVFVEMNRGYASATKIIKNSEVTYSEYAFVGENLSTLPGFSTEIDWIRDYPYGDLFKGVLGKVTSTSQGVPYEFKDLYNALGFKLNDRVGTINSLESEFELFLNSIKGETLSNDSGLYEVLREAKRGNDLVLTMDFELTKAISNKVEEILLDASQYENSKYMDRAFVMISNPKTGEIISMVSRRMITSSEGEKYFVDFSYGLTTSGVLAGSTVKPAFLAAAMDAGALKPGTRMLDECIKIAATPEKCSWKRNLGVLNDLDALYWSSNSYMFKTVINWAGAKYVEDQSLSINPDTFTELRKYYNEFGLGMYTNSDIPKEELGYRNLEKRLPGFLMDLSIGQYDSYTVAQLSQYITTLANGDYKMKPRLIKEVYSSDSEPLTEQIYHFNPIIESEIDIEDKYIDRVRYGMKYSSESKSPLLGKLIEFMPNPAAKTGTAEGFYDTDGDGKINTEHVFISEAFMGFAPYNDPDMAIIIVVPNVRYLSGDEYKYPARENITREVTKIYYDYY